MGSASSKNTNTESINWDKINTESMSSTVPNLMNINKDAKSLISKLDIEKNIEMEDTESDNENIFTWLKKPNEDSSKDIENKSEDFSDTSPFISSDMYKYLVENNKDQPSVTSSNVEGQQAQVGGAKDSSTSTTSSSPKKKEIKNKRFTESSSALSGGDLSYISSSAHTENNISEVKSSEREIEDSSISVQNRMLTSTVNTSDIKLVSSE